MKRYGKKTFWLVLGTLGLSFVVACAKKRDAELPYGADRNLKTISDYESQEWKLQTQELLKPANTGAQVKVTDQRKVKGSQVQNFDYVKYTSEDPLKLTDQTLMLGRPNHLYKVKYVFVGNLLKVMKISAPEDLSNDERAVAEDAGTGRLMVPIVSYNVSFSTIDTSRNDRNEKTSKLELVDVQGREGATHFKIDYNSKTQASFLSKAMTLDANFFTGAKDDNRDWYFAFTVVRQNFNEDKGALGSLLAFDKYGKTANKVRAKKLEDKILFYNLRVDDRLKTSLDRRDENQTAALEIPAEFLNFAFSKNGKTTSVKEEASNEVAWDQRSFVQLKLKDLKIPNLDLKASGIKDVQIGDGYLSFVLLSDAFGGLVRFSLYNTKSYFEDLSQTNKGLSPYQPKIYFPEDEKLFGFFGTRIPTLTSFETSNKQFEDKRKFINRFNPTRSFVEFRLNHEAPEWMDDLVKKAAGGWNASFKEAGLKMRAQVLDQNGKVLRGNPGDLRYSSINVYSEIDGGGGWGGLGPSLKDPDTGEIIMATSNLNIANAIEGTKFMLNSYLLSAKGKLDKKYVLGIPMPSLEVVVNTAENAIKFVGNQIRSSLLKGSNTKFNAVYDSVKKEFRKGLKVVDEKSSQKLTFENYTQFESSYKVTNENIINQVEIVCPDLKSYADSVKADQNRENLENEIKMIQACSVEISKPIILQTLVHEMGHNFGLRHNFYGSVDRENFYGPVEMKMGGKQVKVQWRTSSVMDYMVFNEHNISQPGLYDTAAILWGYTDQVRKYNNTFLKVDPKKPTTPQIQHLMKNHQVRKFKYCTDEDIDENPVDPMCARQDSGLNPVEIVSNLINRYDTSIALLNFRHGRHRSNNFEALAFDRIETYLEPMKRFYEQWRVILAARAGSGNEYLESFEDIDSFKALVESAIEDQPGQEKAVELRRQYKQAADLIFQFLTRMVFQPDYSCVAERTVNGETRYQLFSFSQIQTDIRNITQEVVKSCQDPTVQEYLKGTKNATVLGSGGVAFENIYFDQDQKTYTSDSFEVIDNPEISGIALDRLFALMALTERSAILRSARDLGLAPNYLDEPDHRQEFEAKIEERLFKGVNVTALGLEVAMGKKLPESFSPNFTVEKPLLSLLLPTFQQGLVVPNRDEATSNRMEKYSLKSSFFMENSIASDCFSYSGNKICASSENPAAFKMIQKLNQLQDKKIAWKMSDESPKIFLEAAKEFIPETGKGLELQQISIEKFFRKLQTITKNNPSIKQDIENIQTVFQTEVVLWNVAMRKDRKAIEDQNLSQNESLEKQAELKKTTFGAMAQKLGDKTYQGLDQEILKTRVDAFVKEIKTNYETFSADPREIEAQVDILIRSLMNFR